jgi:hypothetical protein
MFSTSHDTPEPAAPDKQQQQQQQQQKRIQD